MNLEIVPDSAKHITVNGVDWEIVQIQARTTFTIDTKPGFFNPNYRIIDEERCKTTITRGTRGGWVSTAVLTKDGDGDINTLLDNSWIDESYIIIPNENHKRLLSFDNSVLRDNQQQGIIVVTSTWLAHSFFHYDTIDNTMLTVLDNASVISSYIHNTVVEKSNVEDCCVNSSHVYKTRIDMSTITDTYLDNAVVVKSTVSNTNVVDTQVHDCQISVPTDSTVDLILQSCEFRDAIIHNCHGTITTTHARNISLNNVDLIEGQWISVSGLPSAWGTIHLINTTDGVYVHYNQKLTPLNEMEKTFYRHLITTLIKGESVETTINSVEKDYASLESLHAFFTAYTHIWE